MRKPYALDWLNLLLATNLYYEGDLDINLFSNTYLDPNTKVDTDIDIDIKLGTSEDTSLVLEKELNLDLDSKAKEIIKDIT